MILFTNSARYAAAATWNSLGGLPLHIGSVKTEARRKVAEYSALSCLCHDEKKHKTVSFVQLVVYVGFSLDSRRVWRRRLRRTQCWQNSVSKGCRRHPSPRIHDSGIWSEQRHWRLPPRTRRRRGQYYYVTHTLRRAVLTVLSIGFCHTGPVSLCVGWFICVYLCILCVFVSYRSSCSIVSVVGWTWCDWSLILRTYLLSVLWHCWFNGWVI